ncbi:MAG TPA: GNAT family N-acetyltransferase [Candidatus Limnocylindria bacterium]|nr:GNAT family N-acetyltransferase [Candidatus Limnocylindria bacterium]
MTDAARIRPIRPDEHDAVADLTVRAYRARFEDLGDYEGVLRRVGHRASRGTVLVAVMAGQLVGTVTYVRGPGPYAEGDDPDAAWIRMLAVAPEQQGRGLGRALTIACIERARADGRRRIALHTGDTQLAAQRIYAGLGFVRRPALDELVDDEFWLRGWVLELEEEEEAQPRS